MPAQLVALTEGPNILLDKPILLLGRHPECDIQIESHKISRRHCCIAQVEDYLTVRDLGSTNGIRINGVRVQEGRLKPNDELTIGNSRYRVRWDAGEGDNEPANLPQRRNPPGAIGLMRSTTTCWNPVRNPSPWTKRTCRHGKACPHAGTPRPMPTTPLSCPTTWNWLPSATPCGRPPNLTETQPEKTKQPAGLQASGSRPCGLFCLFQFRMGRLPIVRPWKRTPQTAESSARSPAGERQRPPAP